MGDKNRGLLIAILIIGLLSLALLSYQFFIPNDKINQSPTGLTSKFCWERFVSCTAGCYDYYYDICLSNPPAGQSCADTLSNCLDNCIEGYVGQNDCLSLNGIGEGPVSPNDDLWT